MNKIPTSNIEIFRQHLMNPNTPFELTNQEGAVMKVKKNIVLSLVSDNSGCGHIRNIFPVTYLNAVFGKTGKFNMILSPIMIFQHDVLMRTRSIFFQRTMAPGHTAPIKKYKEMQKKYGYKMVFEIDDFIWEGSEEGESIPKYNFGHEGITNDVRKACLDNMNEMDIVCVSTDFLGDYIKNHGVTNPKIVTIPNAVAKYFWGPFKKRLIKERIKKPRVLSTSSPTHYNNKTKMKGDFENAWYDWVIKNVKKNKIEYYQMGGMPWFFDELKKYDNFHMMDWVNSYQYANHVKSVRADFSIGPLVPNYFNYSKSDLKYIESMAYGAVFIGNTWKGTKYEKYPSPYDDCLVQIPYNISVDGIDELFWSLTEPEKYNKILKEQYNILDRDGRWLESEKHVKRYTDIL